jgi:CRP/FNR family cyclic AMP-dependent transcriptional regulator
MTLPMRWELLAGLTEEQRTAVLELTRSRRYKPKDVLFHEGDEGESLHFVVSGRIAIRALTPAGDMATFAILGPGQALGEMALLRRSSQRSASATALEAVETRSLHRKDFFRLCDERPVVERVMVHVLAARVDRLSQHLMDALYRSVDERIVRRLLETVRLYPDAGDGIVLPLTQQDIASLAGTTRPTANIVLNELQDEGILTLTRGKVVVDDLRKLAARAGQ